jgi:hypothetical protein
MMKSSNSFRRTESLTFSAAEAGGGGLVHPLAARSGLLRLTATHEASHAVVCLALGGEVAAITIISGNGYSGKMTPVLSQRQMKDLMTVMLLPGEPIVAREIDADVLRLGCRHIIEYLAGVVGEWSFLPGLSSSTGDRHRRASHDINLATAIARGISASEEEAKALLSDARAKARDILLDRRRLVEAIADALMARGTMTGDEVDEIIDGA